MFGIEKGGQGAYRRNAISGSKKKLTWQNSSNFVRKQLDQWGTRFRVALSLSSRNTSREVCLHQVSSAYNHEEREEN